MAMRLSAQLWTDGSFSGVAMRGQMLARLPVGRHYSSDRRECGYVYLTEMSRLHGTELWSLTLQCGHCRQDGAAVGTDVDESPIAVPDPVVLVPLAAQLELPLGCAGRCRHCLTELPKGRIRLRYCGEPCRRGARRRLRSLSVIAMSRVVGQNPGPG